MKYITTIPLNPKTNKSSRAIFNAFLRSSNFDGYNYIKQEGIAGKGKNFFEYMFIDYQNMLRRARANNKPRFKPISQARWWLDHRVSCFKRGIRFSIHEAINYK